MSNSQIFLGWTEPILQASVKLLVQNHRNETSINFSTVTCALPGKRAGRKLLELLANEGERLGLAVIPPRTVTTGKLPEMLLGINSSTESSLRKHLLWHAVLQEADPNCLKSIFPKLQGWQDSLNMSAWELGCYLDSLRKELGGAGKQFKEIPQMVDGFASEERWRALAKLEEDYLALCQKTETLDQLTLRLAALENPNPIKGELYLIGLTDLNGLTKEALKKSSLDVIALIGAPKDKADLFDEFGCVVIDGWSNQILPLQMSHIHRAEKGSDEAALVVNEIAKLAQGGEAVSDITIGLIDSGDIPVLSEELNRFKITLRPPEGKKYKDSPSATFLLVFARCIENTTVENLGSFIRHPYGSKLIAGADVNRVIEWLDNYQGKHFQYKINSSLFANSNQGLAQALEKTLNLISATPKNKASLIQWRAEVLRVLSMVHSDSLDADSMEAETLSALANFFNEAEELPAGLIPQVSLSQCIRLAIKSLENQGASPEEFGECIEGVGWLELFHDDARNLLVTGFHERALPEAINEDPLLPDDLRRRAGLQSNASRYARDAFLVTALINSRKHIRFSYAALDEDGVERGPSRLFFACEERELTQRVSAILKPAIVTQRRDSIVHSTDWLKNLIPSSSGRDELVLRVTDFKVYLDCRYQYYLTRELRLHGATDNFQELNSLRFGDIAHSILEEFAKRVGDGDLDEPGVLSLVLKITEDFWSAQFGENALPTLFIQKEVLKERLRVWAVHQAALFRQGWRIKSFEVPVKEGMFQLQLKSGQKVSIVGKIDRIDFHQKDNAYRIIDYKTSESARDARSSKTKNGWKDLQLPLYYWMAKELGLGDNISVAYMNISGDHANSGLAELSSDGFDEALVQAQEIAQAILERDLWPPTAKMEPFDESLQLITNQLFLLELEEK
jgi:ATP-dependent helicase/nuclease subunit B